MSHQEKQRIFDEYAKTLNDFDRKIFESFLSSIAIGKKTIREHVFVACDLLQAEQQKRIYETTEIDRLFSNNKEIKASIINPENLIK
ncbi:hypothetical protein [Chryseobacterium aquifrigidense]|uniref:Uncharacterized protein n=1 Tax=Chryseobacterium aquifrigidense TaxID=558021 RepID=A0A543E9Q0_9FLAO|nr:hypothetical protein [Chryseobacterium aquifrigidense]TQM18313.1 hypothetical protein FB551_4094 [Chryseobacterium aquifrigidense]